MAGRWDLDDDDETTYRDSSRKGERGPRHDRGAPKRPREPDQQPLPTEPYPQGTVVIYRPPHTTDPTRPGPVKPGLILASVPAGADGIPMVLIAPGTERGAFEPAETDLALTSIPSIVAAGLRAPGRFEIARHAVVPWTEEWFPGTFKNGRHIHALGTLTASDMEAAKVAARAASRLLDANLVLPRPRRADALSFRSDGPPLKPPCDGDCVVLRFPAEDGTLPEAGVESLILEVRPGRDGAAPTVLAVPSVPAMERDSPWLPHLHPDAYLASSGDELDSLGLDAPRAFLMSKAQEIPWTPAQVACEESGRADAGSLDTDGWRKACVAYGTAVSSIRTYSKDAAGNDVWTPTLPNVPALLAEPPAVGDVVFVHAPYGTDLTHPGARPHYCYVAATRLAQGEDGRDRTIVTVCMATSIKDDRAAGHHGRPTDIDVSDPKSMAELGIKRPTRFCFDPSSVREFEWSHGFMCFHMGDPIIGPMPEAYRKEAARRAAAAVVSLARGRVLAGIDTAPLPASQTASAGAIPAARVDPAKKAEER